MGHAHHARYLAASRYSSGEGHGRGRGHPGHDPHGVPEQGHSGTESNVIIFFFVFWLHFGHLFTHVTSRNDKTRNEMNKKYTFLVFCFHFTKNCEERVKKFFSCFRFVHIFTRYERPETRNIYEEFFSLFFIFKNEEEI